MSDPAQPSESDLMPFLDELRQVRQREQQRSSMPPVEVDSGYEILRELRQGGQGIVFEAIQRSTGRRVALKVLRHGSFRTQREMERFSREVDLLAGLQHRSIVTLYDTAICNGQPCFAMEFIDGQPLNRVPELRVPDRSLSRAVRSDHIVRVLNILVTVCDAVACFQRNGLIHRDLKPDNILVDCEGLPHVVDFGLARNLSVDGDELGAATGGSTFTMTGEFLGTPAYASPEQATGDPHSVDIRSDVYSLGVILFELLTGQLPVPMSGPISVVLQRIVDREPVRPSTLNPVIDRDLDSIILKCLSKDPDRRYQSAAELAADMRRWMNGQAILARSDSTWYLLRKSLRRHKPAVAAVLGFMIMGFGASVIMLMLWRQAVRERNQAQTEAYVASLYGANAAQKEHRVQDALDLLLRPISQLRGWEWDYLLSRTDHSVVTTPLFEGSVQSCVWSFDRTMLAIVDTIGQLRIHRGDDGSPVDLPDQMPSAVPSCIAFRPGHAELLVAHANQEIFCFRPGDAEYEELTGFPDAPIVSVGFDATGDWLAVGQATEQGESLVSVWSMKEQQLVRSLAVPWKIRAVALSPEANTVAVGGPILEVYRLTDGVRLSVVSKLDHPAGAEGTLTCLEYSGDDRLIAAGSTTGAAVLVDVRTGEVLHKLESHMGPVSDLEFSPDFGKLLTGSHDTVTRLWDVNTGHLESAWHGHTDWVRGVSFLGDDEVASVSVPGALKRFRIGFNPGDRRLDLHSSVITGVRFMGSGEILMTSSLDGMLRVTEVSSGHPISSAVAGSIAVTALNANKHRNFIGVGSDDGRIRLFRSRAPDSPEVVPEREYQESSAVRSLAISGDAFRMAVGLESGDIVLQGTTARTSDSVTRIRNHEMPVRFVGFVHHETLLVSEDEKHLKISDARTGRIRHDLNRPLSKYFAPVAIHPQTEIVVAGDSSGRISAWDPVTGEEKPPFEWHASSITALCFSPDGSRLISAARDGSVKIWDVERRSEMFVLPGVQGFVTQLDFSPDHRRIVAGLYDGTVMLFEAVSAAQRVSDLERHRASQP